MQVIFINSHPIQYFAPLYQQIVAESNLKLEVVYLNNETTVTEHLDKEFGTKVKWDIPLLSGYDHLFLANHAPSFLKKNNGFFSIINFGLIKYLLNKKKSVVVINGWKYLSYVMAIIIAGILGHVVVLRGETPFNQEKLKNKLVTSIKHIYLRCLFLFVGKALYIGKQNKLFYQALGFKKKNLLFSPYSVDNKRFREIYNSESQASARLKLELPAEAKIILYSGKYISKKNPLDLLKAFKDIDLPNVLLVMVGEGDLRKEMESFIKTNNLQHSVLLTGFVNQKSIPLYYRAADIFVMCSGLGETWGLSVNEAMNFGLPVLVSKTSGSAHDLIAEDNNGNSFETGNVDELRSLLQKYLRKTHEERAQITTTSLEIIDQYSYSQTIKSLQILAAGNS